MSERRLDGRVALVTGASRGIGRSVAETLARAGASVVATARTARDLEEVVRGIEQEGGSALAATCDVTQEAPAAAAVRTAVDRYGRLDVLINNAGVGCRGKIEDLTLEKWERVFAVNLRGVFLMTRAAVPEMKRAGGGHIVNVSSVAGLVANPGISAYNATKFGLMGFSESLMLELRHDRIKVTAICPGSTDTYFGSPSGPTGQEGYLAAEDVSHAILDLLTTASNALISQVHLRPLVPPRR